MDQQFEKSKVARQALQKKKKKKKAVTNVIEEHVLSSRREITENVLEPMNTRLQLKRSQ